MGRYTPPKKTPPFERAELRDANRDCGMQRLKPAQCGACGQKVLLHCDNCQLQVTGCWCTAVERAREARQNNQNALWTPKDN